MAHAERIQILTSAEESELYGPPNLSVYEQRFLFSFDDMEINRIYRYQECLQRIADGFIHHVRQVKARAKGIAKEQVYQDWQKAARNLGKAADVLQLFRYLSNLMKSFEH